MDLLPRPRPSFWTRAFRRVAAYWRREPLVRESIRHDDRGFTVETYKADERATDQATVSWGDIEQVVAFKRDLFDIDQVCVDFVFLDASWFRVSEDMAGFNDFVRVLPCYLSGCLSREDWWGKVVLHAFAANETVLWNRGSPPRA